MNIPFDQQPADTFCDREDRHEFVDILKRMLVLNQDARLSPVEGLQHNFVSMAHFTPYANSK